MMVDQKSGHLSATELVAKLSKENPTLEFAYNRNENCVGYWSCVQMRFVIIAALSILKPGWFAAPDILVNGEPVVPAKDWIESEI